MARDELLRREIQELRSREASYRDGLRRQLAVAARLREYTHRLMATLRTTASRSAEAAFAEVAAISTAALDVERASIWMVDRRRGVLMCHHLVVRGQPADAAAELPLAGVSTYMRALTKDVIAVDDVASDPRTPELAAYCAERGIGALLDIPILLDGELEGVVCHEHVGPARVWTDAEFDFATSVGNLVTIAIEAERRHLAQARAREVDARYRHLVETLPVGIYSIDVTSGKLSYVSPTVELMSGRRVDELLEGGLEAWLERVVEPDREPIRERLRAGVGRPLHPELVYRITRPDGSIAWIRDLCAQVRDVSGRPIAVQGTLEDITVERETELRRREVERRYRQLLEHVELIGVVLDRDGRVIDANACFERLVGIPRSEIIGKDWFDTVVAAQERDARRTMFRNGISDGHLTVRFENTIRTASGEARQVLWTNTLLYDAHGAVSGTASLGLDLTDRLRLEAELVEQRKFESLGRMAASLAHDFNNVLTILSLAIGNSVDDPEVRSALGHARELVAALLGYARREPLAAIALEVDRTIQDLAPVLSTAAGPDLVCEVELHAAGRHVWISATEIRQLVLNLVTNAAEATRGHGHAIRVTSGVVVEDRPRAEPRLMYQLVVADDGRGMDRATLARAFEPFFTTKHLGSGTGIGLATCQAIASRAGGSIVAESALGQGTTFRVALPVVEPAAARGAEATPAPAALPLLLVEDNATLGTLVARELAAAGYQVERAASVAEALDAIARTAFAILVADLNLGDGRGERVIAAARARSPATAVVVSSAERRELAGVDEIVMKPFTSGQLRAAIERALARHRTPG